MYDIVLSVQNEYASHKKCKQEFYAETNISFRSLFSLQYTPQNAFVNFLLITFNWVTFKHSIASDCNEL